MSLWKTTRKSIRRTKFKMQHRYSQSQIFDFGIIALALAGVMTIAWYLYGYLQPYVGKVDLIEAGTNIIKSGSKVENFQNSYENVQKSLLNNFYNDFEYSLFEDYIARENLDSRLPRYVFRHQIHYQESNIQIFNGQNLYTIGEAEDFVLGRTYEIRQANQRRDYTIYIDDLDDGKLDRVLYAKNSAKKLHYFAEMNPEEQKNELKNFEKIVDLYDQRFQEEKNNK